MSVREEYFDTVNNEWLTWEPLADISTQATMRGLGDQEILQICALGNCGDPSSPNYDPWRQDKLLPILATYGVADRVFNPEAGTWTPDRAPIEGIHLARNAVVIVNVNNSTEAPTGIMETGFAVYGGVMRGQRVIVSVEDAPDASPQIKLARQLCKSALTAAQARYPLFTIAPDITSMAHIAGNELKQRIQQRKSGITSTIEVPPQRRDLKPRIYISGTCGSQRPEWMGALTGMLTTMDADVPVQDSYIAEGFNDYAQATELTHKLNDGVQLIAITNDAASYGALAELGPRVLQADLSGQALGVYIEPPEAGDTSAPARTRISAMEHLGRLRQDFPNLKTFVAEDLRELAVVGLAELYKQRGRLKL
jgi:hypothetical protein